MNTKIDTRRAEALAHYLLEVEADGGKVGISYLKATSEGGQVSSFKLDVTKWFDQDISLGNEVAF